MSNPDELKEENERFNKDPLLERFVGNIKHLLGQGTPAVAITISKGGKLTNGELLKTYPPDLQKAIDDFRTLMWEYIREFYPRLAPLLRENWQAFQNENL